MLSPEAAFEPLPDEGEAPRTSPGSEEPGEIIVPVPDDAPSPPASHRDLGAPSLRYAYRDADGRLLGYVERFETPGRKEIRPLTLWRRSDRRRALVWRRKYWPKPRPLYGLDRLAANPDQPVLVVEGEKAAEAARRLFPELVVVSSSGGAKSVRCTDWSPLAGRTVVSWGDADEDGREYTSAVKQLLLGIGVGARTVNPTRDLPPLPDGWDLADPWPDGWSLELAWNLITAALQPRAAANESDGRPRFKIKPSGVYYVKQDADADEIGEEWVCSRLDVVSKTRDGDGVEWGRLLEITDDDGVKHSWAMPMSLMAGDGTELRATLLGLGLILAPSRTARERLQLYIALANPESRARCVARTGWHGAAYVLPGQTIGATREQVVLQSSASGQAHLQPRGTLADWKLTIGTYSLGNSRLAFAVSAAFAAPLLYLLSEESGGLHLRGGSSLGKTSILRSAASVFGAPTPEGYLRTWRATANGLEGAAEIMCDAPLCLDELGQASPREAGDVVYMIAGGAGKLRARRDGSARKPKTWRNLILSTGEVSLADKMGESGQSAHAGQLVRLLDIPADAGAGFGAFEQLHEFPKPEAFVAALRQAGEANYGTPIRAFLDQITQRDREQLVRDLRASTQEWRRRHCPEDGSEQVGRAADRFALIAAAGELAADVGVLPWEAGEACWAAKVCFEAWLGSRGGKESTEITSAISRIRLCLEKYGESRFPLLGELRPDARADERPVHERWGFRKKVSGRTEYLVLPEAWKHSVCAGLDARQIAKALADRKILKPDSDGKLASRHSLPDFGPGKRAYHITAAIFGDEERTDV